MARSIWNGVISFGMVSIPVRLTTAVTSKDVSFHQLHQKCGSRLKQQRYCPVCERTVEFDEVDRGYEYAKGQHVVLETEDFEKLPLPSKHTIEVSSVAEDKEIDPIYYDSTYYLEPEDTGRKPYALLLKALKEKKVVAIAKIAIRHKESLCVLRPGRDNTIVLETLFYPDEIRKPEETNLDLSSVGDKEMAMADSLIDLLQEPFDPSEYQDKYRETLLEMIEAKMQGGEVREQPETAETGVIDLMDALRASVEAAKKKKA